MVVFNFCDGYQYYGESYDSSNMSYNYDYRETMKEQLRYEKYAKQVNRDKSRHEYKEW